jgi:hypothetical protein
MLIIKVIPKVLSRFVTTNNINITLAQINKVWKIQESFFILQRIKDKA